MMHSTVATFCFIFGSAARRRCSYTNPAYHVLCLHESNLLYAAAVCFVIFDLLCAQGCPSPCSIVIQIGDK
jgi:hypothetical protein